MFNNLVFIGGIHGVGKSTICSEICRSLGFSHLTASKILKWNEVKEDMNDKRVENILYTQERLINGLNTVVSPQNNYLLEGHFTLFDGEGEISKIPIKTFIKIRPVLMAVFSDDPAKIKNRLDSRDGKVYDLLYLDEMQREEIQYGESLCQDLGIPFFQVHKGETSRLILYIKSYFKI